MGMRFCEILAYPTPQGYAYPRLKIVAIEYESTEV
jgi:hypothetical protein